MERIITLTTDFGTEDAYVAAMKGTILGINPRATLVDISHSIEPQNIARGAFVLSTAYSYFPDGTIHMVIIDPEVGSQRRSIIVKTPKSIFVAPDNGVLSYILYHASPIGYHPEAQPKGLPPGLLAFEITNPIFWRHPVSSTFHGRDIFAPVVAHISLGVPLEEFGKTISSINVFPIPQPQVAESGDLIGHVLHIDRFGNIITDIQRESIPLGKFRLEIAGQRIDSLSSAYDQANRLLALIDSSGYLEIALKNSSAAHLLDVKIGDEVSIRKGQ